MIESIISDVLRRIGHTWKVGGQPIQPDEEDVREILDEATRIMYDEGIGSRFESGGIVMDKRPNEEFDVYVYVGTYKKEK